MVMCLFGGEISFKNGEIGFQHFKFHHTRNLLNLKMVVVNYIYNFHSPSVFESNGTDTILLLVLLLIDKLLPS
jgi:hypothetical protein